MSPWWLLLTAASVIALAVFLAAARVGTPTDLNDRKDQS